MLHWVEENASFLLIKKFYSKCPLQVIKNSLWQHVVAFHVFGTILSHKFFTDIKSKLVRLSLTNQFHPNLIQHVNNPSYRVLN
jgi:hypothetical protein